MPRRPPPAPGTVINGYRFNGGDPSNRNSWTPTLMVATNRPTLSPKSEQRIIVDRANRALRQLEAEREWIDANRRYRYDLDRFQNLNTEVGTGGASALGLVRRGLSLVDPRVGEMEGITARMTPAQRPPGSGATSDLEIGMYGRGVPSMERPGQANEAMINQMRAFYDERADRLDFMEQYLTDNQSLEEAAQKWSRYVQAHPYIETDESGMARYLPRRVRWEEFMGVEPPVRRADPRNANNPASGRRVVNPRNPPRKPPAGTGRSQILAVDD